MNTIDNTITRSASDILVCASHGIVYALDKSKGTLLWERAPLPSTSGGAASIFVTDSKRIIVGLEGKTICLNLLNGNVLWKNDMKEFRSSSEVSIVSEPSKVLRPMFFSASNNIIDAPPKYDDSEGDYIAGTNIISSSNGKVVARDAKTGKKIWTYDCLGGTRSFMSLLLSEPSYDDAGNVQDTLFVGVGRSIHCLNTKTGELIWYSKIANGVLGYNYMTLATVWSSRLSSETHTAYSQQPVIFAKRSDERGTPRGVRLSGNMGSKIR